MMKLRGCQDTVIFVFDTQHVKGRFQSFYQIRTRGASVPGEDDLGRAFMNLADLINKCFIKDGLVDA